MARTFDEVLKDALRLRREERMRLVEELRGSLMTAEEREVEAAWIVEAERRMSEIENGTAKLIPGDQVFRELRAKYGPR